MSVVRVYKKGIIVLPKSVRDKVGVEEGMLLKVFIEDDRIVLKPLDLWNRVWGCGKGMGSAEEAELELDREEDVFWGRRKLKK
ncbi:MAG: AbrB/MazE/SpoVT family DNA-binding domain-containing protein [Candidatus Desulfofervidus auxilii]|nr:AbrB/MazE/SpoVT family DNA-binding domain-containing protein [Candidatus Desulfofervidus auxilii]